MLSNGHTLYLNNLIALHHHNFRLLYPEIKLKYKHHGIEHYPTIILKSGSLLPTSVMHYEAKHNYFKRSTHIVCNFQNICLTLGARHQMNQCMPR